MRLKGKFRMRLEAQTYQRARGQGEAMNQAAEPVAVSVLPVSGVGPGVLLRQTRMERQLSLENAALTLRLAPKQAARARAGRL